MTASTTGPSGADRDRANDLSEHSSLANCPWCRRRFVTIVGFLDHVDRWHLAPDLRRTEPDPLGS
jgi:hypothetical protein